MYGSKTSESKFYRLKQHVRGNKTFACCGTFEYIDVAAFSDVQAHQVCFVSGGTRVDDACVYELRSAYRKSGNSGRNDPLTTKLGINRATPRIHSGLQVEQQGAEVVRSRYPEMWPDHSYWRTRRSARRTRVPLYSPSLCSIAPLILVPKNRPMLRAPISTLK